MVREKEVEFMVNESLTLKLEKNETIIYVNGEQFDLCKILLMDIPIGKVDLYKEFESMDKLEEELDRLRERKFEIKERYSIEHFMPIVTPEEEFWAHSSALQFWVENEYNTNFLHRNLAFPLLKRLSEIGDPLALKIFKKEIRKRFLTNHEAVVYFLMKEGYVDFLEEEALKILIMESIITEKKYATEALLNVNYIFEHNYLLKLKDNTIKSIVKDLNSYIEQNYKGNEVKFVRIWMQIIIVEFLKNKWSEDSKVDYYCDGRVRWESNNVVSLSILKSVKDKKIKSFKDVFGLELLASLKRLKLYGFKNERIYGLDTLTDLEVLSLRNNGILNISGLENLKNLKVLDLSFNHIKYICELDGLTELEELNLFSNEILEIKGLDNLKKLKKLNLGLNNIMKIRGLCKLVNLEELRLDRNNIIEIKKHSGLENLKNLKVLNLWCNNIRELKELDELKDLKVKI